MVVSLVFPVVQLVVLGYAFGGKLENLKVGVVDQDRHLSAAGVRELCGAIAANARPFETIVEYVNPGRAPSDLRDGRINGVLTIPPQCDER